MYYDLLARIRNGLHAKRQTIYAPYAKMDFAVAKFLQDEGYVAAVDKRTSGKRPSIEVRLKYKNNLPSITGIKLVSKPSRRTYIGYRDMKSVLQGHGIAAISTPEGIFSNRDARKRKLGGEYLFQIW